MFSNPAGSVSSIVIFNCACKPNSSFYTFLFLPLLPPPHHHTPSLPLLHPLTLLCLPCSISPYLIIRLQKKPKLTHTVHILPRNQLTRSISTFYIFQVIAGKETVLPIVSRFYNELPFFQVATAVSLTFFQPLPTAQFQKQCHPFLGFGMESPHSLEPVSVCFHYVTNTKNLVLKICIELMNPREGWVVFMA